MITVKLSGLEEAHPRLFEPREPPNSQSFRRQLGSAGLFRWRGPEMPLRHVSAHAAKPGCLL